jgi:hypothetical protein
LTLNRDLDLEDMTFIYITFYAFTQRSLWPSMNKIGQAVSEEKIFENGTDRHTDTRTDQKLYATD